MLKIFKKIVLIILVITTLLLLASCSRIITNYADELTMYKWGTKLENGTTISLSFKADNATMIIKNDGGDTRTLSGLCEISPSIFVIHDADTFTYYAFEYIVHFDSVDLVYNKNTVSLHKTD